LNGSAPVELTVPAKQNLALLVHEGTATINGTTANQGDLVVLDRQEGSVIIDVAEPARLLVLSGEPIDEPVVSYGPFVMNSREQILEAIQDFESGKFGHLA